MTGADFHAENGYLHARGVFDAAEMDDVRDDGANDENHVRSAVKQEAVRASVHLDDADEANGSTATPRTPPVTNGGVEEHVNRGQGLMVAGRNPVHWERRPRFRIVA